jgi:hypothetical protein
MDATREDLRRLMGVVGVSNQMTIKPRVNTSILTSAGAAVVQPRFGRYLAVWSLSSCFASAG